MSHNEKKFKIGAILLGTLLAFVCYRLFSLQVNHSVSSEDYELTMNVECEIKCDSGLEKVSFYNIYNPINRGLTLDKIKTAAKDISTWGKEQCSSKAKKMCESVVNYELKNLKTDRWKMGEDKSPYFLN